MEQFEKVVKGLDCCLPETQGKAELSCADCPYDPCRFSVSLPINLIDDVRKLITAQQERIKELEAAIAEWEKFAPFLYAHGMLPEPPKEVKWE